MNKKTSAYHLLLAAIAILFFNGLVGQAIMDPCFYSVNTGQDFNNSETIVSAPVNSADVLKYQNNGWEAAAGLGVSIAPPVNCDAVKVIFLKYTAGTLGQGVGFRLSSPLNQGSVYNFDFTYISHGVGSDGGFSPTVYTSAGSELIVADLIMGSQVNGLTTADNTWTTSTVTFTASANQNGHEWLFFFAGESSGMLMNNCQLNTGEITFDLGPTIQICTGETVELGGPELNDANVLWSTGATTSTIEVSTQGSISVTASNICNSILDQVWVQIFDEPELVQAGDTALCVGTFMTLNTTGLNLENTWLNGSNDSLYTVFEPGTYWVSMTDDCATKIDSVVVSYDSLPDFSLGADTFLCYNEVLLLDATVPFEDATYEWNTGSTASTLEVNNNVTNTYSVNVTNHCGNSSDAIYIEYSLYPEDILAGRYEVCFGVPIILDASAIEGTYVWKNGTTNSTYDVLSPGIYWVTVTDDDGCWVASDTTEVDVIECACPLFVPSAFTPNSDGLNDEFEVVYDCDPYDFHLDIYDRWGGIIYTLHYPEQKWDGKVDGLAMPAGIYHYRVFYREIYDGIPIIKIGHITLFNERG
jgi:gliding motility-associated-like protein